MILVIIETLYTELFSACSGC